MSDKPGDPPLTVRHQLRLWWARARRPEWIACAASQPLLAAYFASEGMWATVGLIVIATVVAQVGLWFAVEERYERERRDANRESIDP